MGKLKLIREMFCIARKNDPIPHKVKLILPRLIIAVLLGMALWAVATMALQSRFNAHPDEFGHVMAGEYYFSHWLRTPIGDPDLDSAVMKNWGFSYLFEIDIVYFIAGKIAQRFFFDSYLALRLFNVGIFILLVLIALTIYHRVPGLALVLVISPQIWYLFSYFNGDAFPLCLSLLSALFFLFTTDTSRRSYCSSRQWAGAVLGVFCGLLSLSKTNYLVLVPFFYVMTVLKLAKPSMPWLDRPNFKLLGISIAVCFLVAGPVWGYDLARDHFEKKTRMLAYKEIHADSALKPSNATSPQGFPYSYLKAKGYRYSDLFRKFNWHKNSLQSFYGVYGYMTITGPKIYYILIILSGLTLFILLTVLALCGSNVRRRILLAVCLVFGILVIFQSTCYSWTKDLQAQGRYLMPLLSIALVAFHEPLRQMRARFFIPFAVLMFILSFWCFVNVGLRCIPKVG